MRREADAYTVQAADLRQIADAAQRSTTHSMTPNATGSCNSFAKI
jgi:hypothetical protein